MLFEVFRVHWGGVWEMRENVIGAKLKGSDPIRRLLSVYCQQSRKRVYEFNNQKKQVQIKLDDQPSRFNQGDIGVREGDCYLCQTTMKMINIRSDLRCCNRFESTSLPTTCQGSPSTIHYAQKCIQARSPCLKSLSFGVKKPR